jgi:hypothetical protein
MPVPPPLPDPSHLETRLLIVAEMLEKAVAEVRRVTAEMKSCDPEDPETFDPSGSPDADV